MAHERIRFEPFICPSKLWQPSYLQGQRLARSWCAMGCVQTTMREANDRGYECLLVEEATASYFPQFKQAVLESAGVVGAREIAEFGDWRAYLAASAEAGSPSQTQR